MKKITFSEQKPDSPGLYLVKAGSDNSCVLLVRVIEESCHCESCDGKGRVGNRDCRECDSTGMGLELSVTHSDYYGMVESECLQDFHTDGPGSRRKKSRKPDLWSENIEGCI